MMESLVLATMNAIPRINRSECPTLPKGWIREEIPRQSNNINSAGGKYDVYYYSPLGKKIRSKQELAKTLGDHYDLSSFDFMTGKFLGKSRTVVSSSGGSDNKRKSTPNGHRSGGAGGYDYMSKNLRLDASLVPPIRQTASIFKQPVTVHRSQTTVRTQSNESSNSKSKADRQAGGEKPKQLFWEKRLAGLRPSYPNDEFQPFELPPIFKPVGPGIECESALASISTALHMANGTAIIGQTMKKSVEDFAAFINPDQPLISSTVVTQADIDRQEAIVKETRLKLAQAIEALYG